MSTRRCNAVERKALSQHMDPYTGLTEPALGTLAERLDIIYRRQGGHTTIRLTKEEKRQRAEAEVS